MLSYSMTAIVAGSTTDHTFWYSNVIGDFKNPDSPDFHLVIFENGSQTCLATSRIISLTYSEEYAKCLDFWKQQQQ